MVTLSVTSRQKTREEKKIKNRDLLLSQTQSSVCHSTSIPLARVWSQGSVFIEGWGKEVSCMLKRKGKDLLNN